MSTGYPTYTRQSNLSHTETRRQQQKCTVADTRPPPSPSPKKALFATKAITVQYAYHASRPLLPLPLASSIALSQLSSADFCNVAGKGVRKRKLEGESWPSPNFHHRQTDCSCCFRLDLFPASGSLPERYHTNARAYVDIT